DLADRVLATVLQQNLALPPTVLAHLFAVSKDTIRHITSEIRRLMDQHAHTSQPPAAHLSTLTGLLVHATAHGVTLTTEIKPTC
ncbi:ISAzo13 family transposase, partial [Streptomyces sp. NPDC059460]